MLACAFIEYNGREDLRVRSRDDQSVLASAMARICLMWLLGFLVAAFVFLFGAGKGISFCSSAPNKRNKNSRGESIPFQTIKYSQQPTSSKVCSIQ